jgi:hypothetical protein
MGDENFPKVLLGTCSEKEPKGGHYGKFRLLTHLNPYVSVIKHAATLSGPLAPRL